MTQKVWVHNFGLDENKEGPVIGKMFGVLVVRNKEGEVGYLSAFSGKLAGGNHHDKFVPPVFDMLTEGSFLNNGMKKLTEIGLSIKRLKEEKVDKNEIAHLKNERKNLSISLQEKLFDQYYFLNQAGEEKSLRDIFQKSLNKKPPSAAGECAAPKLLQYAFQNQMKPIAMAEFWWGLSPKSDHWKHAHYYPACQDKCAPILAHMLEGMEVDDAPENSK